MNPPEQAPAHLVEQASSYMRDYIESGRSRTDLLKEVAELVIQLRRSYTLEDGRADWSGRSPAYRAAIMEIYERGRVPRDRYDTVQAALRYHVGNLLRERVPVEELAAVGLSKVAPRERINRTRDVVAALAEDGSVASITGDPIRLVTHAEALLDFVDPDRLAELKGKERVAARHGLRHLSARAAELAAQLAPVSRPRKVV